MWSKCSGAGVVWQGWCVGAGVVWPVWCGRDGAVRWACCGEVLWCGWSGGLVRCGGTDVLLELVWCGRCGVAGVVW